MNDDLKREEVLKNAPFLAKWLNLLFLLIVPSIVAQLLNNSFTMQHMTFFYALGQVLNFACFFAYGYILLKLSDINKLYRAAGICNIITASLHMITYLLTQDSVTVFSLVLSVPMVIISVISINKEYHAHSEVLRGIDDSLSLKWLKLWKWYLIFLIIMIAANFIILISLSLGIFATFFGMGGSSVVSIFQLIYLYQTARCFKRIADESF